jgi:hypothetical protein
MIAAQSVKPMSLMASRLLPTLAVAGSVTAVAGYVRSQLEYERRIMDSRFAPYNTTKSEQARRQAFRGVEDPRSSFFNVLGW